MAPKGFADPNRVQRMQLPPARRRFRKLFRDLIVAKFGARVLARRATANILQHVERKAVGALNVGEDLRGGYFVAAAAALVAARQEEHRQRRRAHPPPPADAKTRQWASEASKGAGRAPSPAGAAAMAFSAPMDGPGLSIDASLSFDTAAPTGELLRLKPLLRCSLLCLLVNAVVMLIVDYVPAAVVDILTVMYGYMLLRRDMQGLAQGLPAFTLIAGRSRHRRRRGEVVLWRRCCSCCRLSSCCRRAHCWCSAPGRVHDESQHASLGASQCQKYVLGEGPRGATIQHAWRHRAIE
ncbi:unnamed protein product [Prorocentrum cordatum]|uniref:Uncharacterized protein n=1 Tax=Prorocentrum cordatum TaxID=2364126 RepID=A0ABN9TQH1_9DINO|nr:unnamed protein product [Polarella glacialis]